MTEPGRRVLTRVGLRIPASVGSASVAAESTGSESVIPKSVGPQERGNGHAARFEHMADVATTAERSGFDSIWVTDTAGEGPASSEGVPAFEAYTLLGALASRTRTASLGAMVSPMTARNPAVLAKIVTGVDVLSGGRAVLGVGIGAAGAMIVGRDSASGEDSATGEESSLPHPFLDARVDSLAEGLHICRAMFTEEVPSFEGRYYRIQKVQNRPRPIQVKGIPILVGGVEREEGVEDSVLELVARYGDAVTLAGRVETVRDRLNTLDRLCEEVGRDPAAISRIGTGRLVIAPTEKEAAQRFDRVASCEAWNPDDRAAATTGSPDAVADQVGELLKVGVDGVVFTMAYADDLELVELAGTALRSVFDSASFD
jgi:alkanesulfonate monooxygenase SsuD/methylene tetrahydromethanopterin reductase-like flavin-dependent oxidoreductase (luciferase family)